MSKNRKKIENETRFLFNGVQLAFNLGAYTKELARLKVKFYVDVCQELAKDFLKIKGLFYGNIVDCNMRIKCRIEDIRFYEEQEFYRIDILGEEVCQDD